MALIRVIHEDEAEGLLARLYKSAIARAGKVYNIIKIQGLRPESVRSSVGLYSDVMFGESDLTRAEREMLAVVVSTTNGCHY